jgi:dolichol-phosphate mannosyltransferase
VAELQVAEAGTQARPKVRAWLEHPRFREFFRYSVVGSSSTAIDFGLLALLTDFWSWHPLAANPVSFVMGVTNGFIWNRRWTFRAARHDEPVAQYVRFVLVNLGGVAIDQAILAIALAVGSGSGLTLNLSTWAGKLAAIPFVVVWNFTANSRWTFKPRETPRTEGEPATARASARPRRR